MAEPEMPDSLPAGPSAEESRRRADTRHLVRASMIVSGLGTAAKVLGLLREMASAAIFGATRLMDSFRVANDITQMFATWVEAPLRAAIIPYFTQVRAEVGEAEAWRRVSNVLNTLAVFLLMVVLLLFFGADALVRLFASGFHDEPEAWATSAALVRILAFSLFFSVLAVVLGSLQNLYRRQVFPALGRVLNAGAVVLAVALLGRTIGIEGYALGILAGAMATFVLQLGILWRFRRSYRFVLRPFAPEVRRIVTIALPLFIGLTGTRLDVLIDRNFASYLPGGHLAVLGYALIASAVVTDLVIMIAQQVLLPHFADLAVEGRYDELRRRLGQATVGYIFFMLPVTAFLCGAARPVVDFLYTRGNFSTDAATLTATVLPVFALAAPIYGINQMLSQVFIADGDTRTPVVIGFYRIGVKTVLSLALFFPLGILGLAIASTVSAFFRGGMLWHRLRDAVKPRRADIGRDVAWLMAASLVAVLVTAATTFVSAGWVSGWVEQLALLLASAALAGLSFLAVAAIGRVDTIRLVLDRLPGRRGRRR